MEKFILTPKLIEDMGYESRRIAEEKFDATKISRRLVDELLHGGGGIFEQGVRTRGAWRLFED